LERGTLPTGFFAAASGSFSGLFSAGFAAPAFTPARLAVALFDVVARASPAACALGAAEAGRPARLFVSETETSAATALAGVRRFPDRALVNVALKST
jgi:hypothetical protein